MGVSNTVQQLSVFLETEKDVWKKYWMYWQKKV